MGRGLGEGYWWGHGVRGIVEERGESTGGRGADRWKEKENTRTSLLSFYGALCEQSNEVQITARDC